MRSHLVPWAVARVKAKQGRTISSARLGFSGALLYGVVQCGAACTLKPPPIERAALLAERHREPEAIALLEEHLTQEPFADRERRLLIRLYGSVGRVDAAAIQTERLAEYLPPGSPIPWVELGHACELAHRYDEALAAYDRAASVAPADALGPRNGGLRAARWGELEWAEPRLEEALRRKSSDAEVWHALGLVRARLGNFESAREAYSKGLAADPAALENRLGLATVALQLDQPAAALEQYELLLAARPRFVEALLGKSWSLIAMGKLDAAEHVLERAEQLRVDRESVSRQRRAIAERRQPGAALP